MSKFIEVLKDGLTVQGKVCMAGERRQVRDDFPLKGKKAQAKMWGAPRYRAITRADFEGTGGKIIDDEPAAPEGSDDDRVSLDDHVLAAAAGDEGTTETTEDKFASFAELNVEDTLQAAAGLSEDDLAEFIVHEQAGEARKTVLESLGVETGE